MRLGLSEGGSVGCDPDQGDTTGLPFGNLATQATGAPAQFLGGQLIRSGGGVFEVMMGKELIFSKKSTGRFPEESEVFTAIEGRL